MDAGAVYKVVFNYRQHWVKQGFKQNMKLFTCPLHLQSFLVIDRITE